MPILDQILAKKAEDVRELRARALPAPPQRTHLNETFIPGDKRLRLICEFKRRSPSAGELSTEMSIEERAAAYQKAGASMMSVLCDSSFFGGGWEDLSRVSATSTIPLLAKEFIIDEVQLDAACAFGASAALLIVRCLEQERLSALIAACHERDLTPLVEVVTEEESQRALDAGADWIGVNARDLDTLVMDSERAQRVLTELPENIRRFHFSGVKTRADVTRVKESGATGALIGEVLMRQNDPVPLLAELFSAV